VDVHAPLEHGRDPFGSRCRPSASWFERPRTDGSGHILVDQLSRDEVDPERLVRRRDLRWVDLQGGGPGDVALLRGDEPGRRHLAQHDVAAFARRLRVFDRVVSARIADAGGQRRGLGQGQVVQFLGEVTLRSGTDPVGAGAEVDPVQVALEDLVLGQAPFQFDRPDCLDDLAVQGLFGGAIEQEGVLDVLLGDGRGTTRDATRRDVADPGAQDGLDVDAVVVVELAILRGDDACCRMSGTSANGTGSRFSLKLISASSDPSAA
jgi:hypothetical protein